MPTAAFIFLLTAAVCSADDPRPIGPAFRSATNAFVYKFVVGTKGPLSDISYACDKVLSENSLRASVLRSTGFAFVVKGIPTKGIDANEPIGFDGEFEVKSFERGEFTLQAVPGAKIVSKKKKEVAQLEAPKVEPFKWEFEAVGKFGPQGIGDQKNWLAVDSFKAIEILTADEVLLEGIRRFPASGAGPVGGPIRASTRRASRPRASCFSHQSFQSRQSR